MLFKIGLVIVYSLGLFWGLGALAVFKNADVAKAQYRSYPDCADALSSPADILHSSCFRIKKDMEIVEVINFI